MPVGVQELCSRFLLWCWWIGWGNLGQASLYLLSFILVHCELDFSRQIRWPREFINVFDFQTVIRFFYKCGKSCKFLYLIDFCPSFTSSFTIVHQLHYLNYILQQNLSFKLTRFFTLISFCNSRFLFTPIFASKFTYNQSYIYQVL